jgi:hypothetical protein
LLLALLGLVMMHIRMCLRFCMTDSLLCRFDVDGDETLGFSTATPHPTAPWCRDPLERRCSQQTHLVGNLQTALTQLADVAIWSSWVSRRLMTQRHRPQQVSTMSGQPFSPELLGASILNLTVTLRDA